ncbi:hypothetical protein LPUS_10824 [Lasallia pustulata]|uniref:Uncharacterized protein n=1 Tax=Lasallia pustulata TaxID=136370 RepID=A0A1W5DAQ9_9LECA|nr:hypothetical protein LPUS_10824 [Lasallia pustulata]
MPTASMGPESPGDVIRHWLAHMNGRDGTFVAGKRQERDVDEDRRGRYPADHHFGNRHAPRQETEFGLGQHRREAIRVMPVDAEYRGRAKPVDKPGQSLASRLGLQAPFRLLGDENHTQDLQRHERPRMKKRRISVSSGTTYLQPATAAFNVDSESDNRKRSRQRRSRLGLYKADSDDSTSPNISSSSSSVTECSPKMPAKPYERRLRHKTRDDRYEKKQDKKLAKTRAKKTMRKDGKRKRKAISGAAVAHAFKAKNVTQDRLTLNPVRKVGLFKKGRASSPVRRKGLPDLTFSEMTFLSTRRGRDRENEEVANGNKRRRKDKVADAEEEISRFFTSTRFPTAESDAEICQTRLHGHGAVTDSRRRRTENKRCASSANSSALPESIAADLPGRPFLGFGNRGARPMAPASVQENTSATSATNSPMRELSISTDLARSHFTWSRSGAASQGSGTDGPIGCKESGPLGKGNGSTSGGPVLSAGQLEPSDPPICHCHCQADGGSTKKFPDENRLRTDAAMPNAQSGESPKAAEQDQSHQEDIKEAKPEGQKHERQPVANASCEQQATRLGTADVRDCECTALEASLLPVEENIAQEEGLEAFDSDIDRLLHDWKTNAAELVRGQDQHIQTASLEEQDVLSPLQVSQQNSDPARQDALQEPIQTCVRYLQLNNCNNDAGHDQAIGVGPIPDCTIDSGPGPDTFRTECDGVYGRNISTSATEGRFTVSQGIKNAGGNAWQGARRFYSSQTSERGRPATECSDTLIRDSSVGIVCGSWPLACNYNLAGPSTERMSYPNLYATQDSGLDHDPHPFHHGRAESRPVNNPPDKREDDVEGWGTRSDGATVVQDLKPWGECRFSDGYEHIDAADDLPITSSSVSASKIEQVESCGYARHRLIGLGSSAGLSLSPFPRLGDAGTLFSKDTGDQRYTNSPSMAGFWQPHKLY